MFAYSLTNSGSILGTIYPLPTSPDANRGFNDSIAFAIHWLIFGLFLLHTGTVGAVDTKLNLNIF